MNSKQKGWARLTLAIGLAVAALALLWLLPQLARAATITVGTGGTYATIQEAVDAANPGDEIRVRNEVFTDSLMITKSLTLLGGYTDAGFTTRTPRTTVISPTGRGIAITNTTTGPGIDVTVDGFEIVSASVVGSGGGIYVDVEDDSRIVINDNFIHDNSATSGGGIYADVQNRSDLQITNNDITTNTTTGSYGGVYAYTYLSTTLVITGNNVISNSASS